MRKRSILGIQKQGYQWQGEDPFIVAMYHKDHYPAGNEEQGVDPEYLTGRNIGQDFEMRNGFRMYHGNPVPGFPAHPHKGFETVTVVLEGLVDHFDSAGANGRYGNGDVQWLTTGRGCQHTEMFPLINASKPNPAELFQIWLNLSAEGKKAAPDYKMLWAEDIPVIEEVTEKGKKSFIRVITGSLQGKKSLKPNAASWAYKDEHHVGIYVVRMESEAAFTLPAVSNTLNRNLYYYEGDTIEVDGEVIETSYRVKLVGDQEVLIKNGAQESYLLVLEGEPIQEPVASYGPFVMNTKAEIYEAIEEYQKTQFGGWQWGRHDPVNPRGAGRFAKYADGSIEKK